MNTMMRGEDKKRLRFKYEDDIILLQEIISRNPYANGCAVWEEVKSSMLHLTAKEFSVKSIRQHIQLLLDQWVNKENKNQKSSGIEEPYSQKDVLLQELYDLIRDIKTRNKEKATKVAKKKADTEIGKEIREFAALRCIQSDEVRTNFGSEHDYAMNSDTRITENIDQPEFDEVFEPVTEEENQEQTPIEEVVATVVNEKDPEKSIPKNKTPIINRNINNSRNIIGPTKTRAKKTNYMRRSGLDYLREKIFKEMELEERRLKIEERKVAVSERSIALAEKKFQFESEQYKNIFEKQQEVINKLLDIVVKYK